MTAPTVIPAMTPDPMFFFGVEGVVRSGIAENIVEFK
jgi:hypothetical protein